MIERTLKGEKRAIARLISVVEDEGPQAREALAQLNPHTGQAHIVGVERAARELENILRQELMKGLFDRVEKGLLEEFVGRVARRELDPYSAAKRLLERLC